MELPKRESVLTCELTEGVVAVLRTLTSKELAALWERSSPTFEKLKDEESGGSHAGVSLSVSFAETVEAFESHLVGFEGEDAPTFDEKPFEEGNAEHLARIPSAWKITGGSELVSDAVLVGATRGNSGAPEGLSRED